MASQTYVHGYSAIEGARLSAQANALSELLHHDTAYPAGNRVLESGCGTGAQTVYLASHSPAARIVSVDISAESLAQARARIEAAGHRNVEFHQGDIYDLPFPAAHFDHVFSCFVLEHLADPVGALKSMQRVVKPGGTITAIEGDHGSWFAYPQTPESIRAVQCLIEVQAHLGGDSLIGRRLYPLFIEAGLESVRVSPRMVYVDASRPDLAESISKRTFIAMVEGVRDQAVSMGLIDEPTWQKGVADLYRFATPDGTFCYTFFKALATLPG